MPASLRFSASLLMLLASGPAALVTGLLTFVLTSGRSLDERRDAAGLAAEGTFPTGIMVGAALGSQRGRRQASVLVPGRPATGEEGSASESDERP